MAKFFNIVAYLPPKLTLERARECLDYIVDLISEAKRSFKICSILVSGDFNHWPVEEILLDHPEMKEIDHGPSRGSRKIDRAFCSFYGAVEESTTLEPLDDERGSESDHRVVFLSANFRTERQKTVTYSYRHYTPAGARQFQAWIATAQWGSVYTTSTTSRKAAAFQSILDEGMDRFFPVKTNTKRESDPPWINQKIRDLVMRRRKVYDREGRSGRWRKMKKKTAKLVRQRARAY